LSTLTQVAGFPCSLASAGPAIASTIAPSTASPASQPSTNPGPLSLPRWDMSISTTAIIGIGLSATPTASGSACPIAAPI
jgi:hypothetical protein